MKIGDLVRQKFSFDDWQKDNPWMEDEGHTGVVIKTANPKRSKVAMICVHWFINGHKGWYGEHKLEVTDESR